MIQATIRMTTPHQKTGEVMKILRTEVEHCRYEPGCLNCHLYGDLQEKNVLVVEEIWNSEEELNLHLRSDKYRNLLLILEMSPNQPEIRFDTISSSAGLEIIEKARALTK